MKKAIVILPLFVLTGCSTDVLCGLLGEFGGAFEGDAEGDLMVDVSAAEEDGMANAEIRLTAPPLDVFGTAVIDCSGGEFMARLETDDNPDFGIFEGILGDEDGDGHWSFNDAAMSSGTWNLARLAGGN